MPPGRFWEFSTKPGCCCEGKASGQIIPVAWPPFRVCSSSCLPPFSQMPEDGSQHTTAPGERGCALEKLPRAARSMGSCTSQGAEAALQSSGQSASPKEILRSCCCPGTSSVSGALAAAFLQQSNDLVLVFFFFFLHELAQNPTSYVLQKLNP